MANAEQETETRTMNKIQPVKGKAAKETEKENHVKIEIQKGKDTISKTLSEKTIKHEAVAIII